MAATKYIFAAKKGLSCTGKIGGFCVPIERVAEALKHTNLTMQKLSDEVDGLFEILGMRNLSAFVGEVFVRSLAKACPDLLVKNPHQDGYPDLLALTPDGKALLKKLEKDMRQKGAFSDFATGGIEVKATCGSVPTPAALAKKGRTKPEIGESRIDVMIGYDWKAHHRQTTNLVGVVWDFIDGLPAVVGLYFGDISTKDWGEIVQPHEGGGRTTSVSIMNRGGIAKMYKGWVAVIDDDRYINFFDDYNKSDLLKRAKQAG